MDHSQALTILLAFAGQPGRPPPDLDAAIAHMAACPACAAGAGQLIDALRLAAEDRLTCAESEGLLPEYLAALAMGGGDVAQWEDLRVHLAGCPACTAALADLAELQALSDGAFGVEPPAYPAPRRVGAASAPRPWRLDELGRLVVDLARALVPPSSAPALAGLKAAPGQTTLATATLSEALPDLELHIAVEGRPDADRRILVVTVIIPSRGGWPNLGGSEVALLQGGREVVRATTDPFGTVAFTGLAAADIDRFTLAVRPGAAGG
ncbi:MAG: hypothetical protein HGA45_28695 [Chloroflexales bacterium]|nr:hypothetical protein [Chloroflexales bacterium]